MKRAHTVTLTGVVSGGWFTGTVCKGDHPFRSRLGQRRPITCRVEDAPHEVAELIEWATKLDVIHPTLDL